MKRGEFLMINREIKNQDINTNTPISELIAEIDENGFFIFISKGYEDILGYTQEDLLNKNFQNILHSEDREIIQKKRILVWKIENLYINISRFCHKNGSLLHFEWTINFFKDAQGQKRAVIISIEIPDFERNKLTNSNESQIRKYNIFAVTDPKGKIIYANSPFCAISNFNLEELIGEDHKIVNSGFHSKKFFKEMYTSLQKGNIWRGEIRNRAKNGNIYWLDTIIVPVTNTDGTLSHYLGIRTDITQRKQEIEIFITKNKTPEQKEESLDGENNLLATILNNISMLVANLDNQFNFKYVNQAYADTYKLPATFFLGRNYFDIFPNEEIRIIFQRVIESGNPFFINSKPFQFPGQLEQNATYWDWNLKPVIDKDKKVESIIFTLRDVTDKIISKKNAEETLKISQAIMQSIFENSFESILFIDPERKLRFFNQIASARSLALFGKPLEDEYSIYDFVLPEDRENFDKHFHSALEGKKTIVDRSVSMNNSNYWFQFQYAPVKNEKNEIFGVLFTGRDINEKKHAEEELKESENRFHAIFDQTPLGIALVESITGEFIQINPKLCEIIGYKEEEIIGKRFLDITHPEDIKLSFDKWEILSDGETNPISYEKRYIKKNGETIWVNGKIVPLFGKEKNSIYYLIIMLDITEFRKTNETLKKNMSDLENLNKTKDKFFSIIAHDLRNPFGGIIGITEILDVKMRQEQMNESMNLYLRYIQIVHGAAKSAHRLLENLLQWARSQTGEISVRPQNFSMSSLLSQVIPIVSGNAFKKNITIEKNLVGNESVYADESLVATILRNLLTNAVKFTNTNGKIIISTEKKEDFLEISISDTGNGIEPDNLEKLFRIDSKIPRQETENEIGSGLGLCKEFVEKHGGKIWAESQPGVGSKFTFTLPLSSWQGE